MIEYQRACAAGLCAAICAIGATEAQAGAFQLNERSAKALGAGLSGSVSAASDVTFATFNPAALKSVESLEIGGNLSGVFPTTDGTFETGPAEGYSFSSSQAAPLASFAAGYRVNESLVVGLTSYSPFGLVTKHPDNFPGAADGTTSDLLTLQISPTVSWELTDKFAIGASVDILYLDVRLNSAITNLDGDDVAFGGSIGALWQPVDGTQIGLAYHSGFDLTTSGTQQNALLGGVSAPLSADASLPGFLQLGVTQEITEDFRLMAEGRWIRWSAFDSLEFSSPALAGTPFASFEEEQNYDDSFFVAVGGEYDVTDAFTMRGGISYDDTPTNDEFRTVRVPDGSRVWFSLGASYAMNEHMSIDVAYNYLRVFEEPDVTLRNGALAGSVIGYEGDVHIISVGGTIKF